MDSALDGITLVSMTGVLLYANTAFWKLSGFGDDLAGKLLSEFYTPEEYACRRR